MSELFEESVKTFLTPVLPFLEDKDVSEIMINGPKEIWIEKKGLLEKTSAVFKDEQALQAAVRNIAQYVGRKIDDEHPMLDARLPNGSRIHAVIPPCARNGTTVAIRKFKKGKLTFLDLVKMGSLTEDAARFLDVCVYLAKNIIISGGTGSGKTSLLNVLGSRIPKTQRILVIEDSSELQIGAEHTVYFETKAANALGEGEIAIRDLVKSSLRLRPDRIVVGEVRGEEALDLVTAMNTGHGGSMGTVHANSPYDALVRLETLALMGGTQVPLLAIRRQISAAINIIVQIKRFNDGTRKIVQISETLPDVDESGKYRIQHLFEYVQKSRSQSGQVLGELIPTGILPSFFDEIEVNRIPFKREKFDPPAWYKKSA